MGDPPTSGVNNDDPQAIKHAAVLQQVSSMCCYDADTYGCIEPRTVEQIKESQHLDIDSS